MSYNPATDFLALWRESMLAAEKAAMPGLDFVVVALGRAGLLNVSVSGTAPVANQSTTAWFQPAVPSSAAEGALFLWDKLTAAYAPASARLFLEFLQASAGQNGRSWWTSTGGPPLNVVGNDGDFAIRLDGVGGIYGPKAAGAWPADPLPGTTNTINQDAMDKTFGDVPGSMIYRGLVEWVSLPIGAKNTVLSPVGAPNALPVWRPMTQLLDVVFGALQGSILFRGADFWDVLEAGADNQVLTTHGANADPSWTPKSSEFAPGTRMLFHQTAAPTGWTKDTNIDNVGLRVVSGAVGFTAGVPFSTVFSQTQVGNTTLTVDQIPLHAHTYVNGINVGGPTGPIAVAAQGATGVGGTDGAGGGQSHTHSVQLNLSYVDVIIAEKDAI